MSDPGVHLTRTEENVAEIDALAGSLGGRVGLEVLLDDLDRRGRRSWLPARAVHRAYTFDAADRRDRTWWPQGVSTSADADFSGERGLVAGRRLVLVSWYAKDEQGSRVTFFDLDTRRYRHVLIVVPAVENGAPSTTPLRVHAGGIVWHGPYLHVAATRQGFFTCRLDDLLRTDEGGYVLPVRFGYRAVTGEGRDELRYSFVSLDRSVEPPGLVAGEYGRGRQTRRLASVPIDPETLLPAAAEDGSSRPALLGGGVTGMQGAVGARGSYYVTVSHGPWTFGSVYAGAPGHFRRHRWATPMGPEDISYWPAADELWSVSEHPRRRWIYSMKRSWFD